MIEIKRIYEKIVNALQIEPDFVNVYILEKDKLNRISILKYGKENGGEFEEEEITTTDLVDIIYELLNSQTIMIKDDIEIKKVNNPILGDSYYAIINYCDKIIIANLRIVDSV